MALFKFTKSIYERRAIDLYNHGNMVRDFTYIGDVIEAIARIIDSPPRPQASFDPLATEPDVSEAPWRIYNIGNGNPVKLRTFLEILEKEIT